MVDIHSSGGVVTVDARLNVTNEPALAEKIKETALGTPGVKEVLMHTLPISAYARNDYCDV